jgi:O-antigen/teichoic acid export membrane protein
MRWRAVQLGGVQAIYFVRLIVLARLLTPDAFGLVAIAMIAIGIVARVTDVGMIPALVQRGAATSGEFDAAWTVGLVRALTLAIVLTAFAQPVASLFGEPPAAPVLRALAWRPVIEAAASIGVVRLTQQLQFRRLAMIALPAALVDLAVAIATARSLGVWALVAGALAGSATTVVLSYALAPHAPRLNLQFAAIRPLIHFGRWVLATGIVALAGTTLSQLAVSRLEGAAALGLYFLAWRVAFTPVDAVSAVVSAVAFPLFARLRDNATETAATFQRLLIGQTIVLVPGYALFFVLAPPLEAALGGRWSGTAPVIRILAVAAVTGILGELLGPLLMGRGRADRAFRLELVQTGVLIAALYPLVSELGVRGAALAWLAGNVCALLVAIAWLRSTVPGGIGIRPQPLLAAVAAAAAASAAAVALVGLAGPLSGLVLAAVGGLIVAALALLVLDRALTLNLMELAKWVRGAGHDNRAP